MSKRPRRTSLDLSTAIIALISVAAVVVVYLRDGMDKVVGVFMSNFHLLGETMPKVLGGCLIGSFMSLMLPREHVARLVGAESGFSGLLIATATAIVLPGGPFTIYPVAMAFLTLGADVGTAVAFITSWTLLGYNRALVWEVPFFGADFVIWRIVVSIPLPIIAGLLARSAAQIIRTRMGVDKWP